MYRQLLCLSLLVGTCSSARAEHTIVLEELIVTATAMDAPLTVVTDAKAPRQPLPAQDGADYLKTIPGFAVTRKGGTSGDPMFRGMAGSRLAFSMDGSDILGGCSSRMDPPTAYIFPESYDTIRVIKGPQTVVYGSGNSAGVVLFERDAERRQNPGWTFYGSALAGNFDRYDQNVDLSAGTPNYYLRVLGSHSQQDHYQDGDGDEVHSAYERRSGEIAAGWTPNDDVTIELSGGQSDAEAAYADRGMDGSQFARRNLNLKIIAENLSPQISKIEARLFHTYADHVMDNFSLREPGGMMPMPMAVNRDRTTQGARVIATLTPSPSSTLQVGVDTQRNEHAERSTMNQLMMPYENFDRITDAEFEQVGLFAEWEKQLDNRQRIVAGLRIDQWQAEDLRASVKIGMENIDNPTANQRRRDYLNSGFVRFEQDHQQRPLTVYAGIGHSERFPDYWELFPNESTASISAFALNPEVTDQIDLGTIYHGEKIDASASIFFNHIDDYLLVQTGVMKPALMSDGMPDGMDDMAGMPDDMMGMRNATVTRNVDATTWGLESEITYSFTDNWRINISMASVRGRNKTDHTYLAQMPPFELRSGVYYANEKWSASAYWRSVASQSRIDIAKGNIAGQDIAPSDSFNVFSINAGWQITPRVTLTSGIDNLLNETYAEHISKSGAAIPGYMQTTRVHEPGRTAWLKAQYRF